MNERADEKKPRLSGLDSNCVNWREPREITEVWHLEDGPIPADRIPEVLYALCTDSQETRSHAAYWKQREVPSHPPEQAVAARGYRFSPIDPRESC